MNTFKTLKIQWKKVVVLGVLTLTQALALTGSAEAAPRNQAPRIQAPAWNNQGRDNRFDNNRNTPHFNNAPHFDTRSDKKQYQERYDNNRNDNYNHKDDNGNSTAKIIGAGIVGAILGSVLSR